MNAHLRLSARVLTVLSVVASLLLVLAAPAAAQTVRDYEWHIAALRIADAQKVTDGSGVTVAVLDSGVDASHPDLAGKVVAGKGFGTDAAADGRADADTKEGHGTAMSALIAGKGKGRNSVLGVAPGVKIMPVSTGTAPTVGEIASGIRWAVDNGAKVINISIGRSGQDISVQRELSAIKYALDKNVVIVAAAGNTAQSGKGVAWPAKVPGVVAVSGVDEKFAAWEGSGKGAETVISAPATRLISAAPKSVSSSGYVLSDGTSGASAIVAGVAALIRARYPQLDAKNVVNRLVSTALDRGTPGRDAEFGFGIVQPAAALGQVSDVQQWPIDTPTVAPTSQSGASGISFKVPKMFETDSGTSAGILLLGAVVLLLGLFGGRIWRRPKPPKTDPMGLPGGFHRSLTALGEAPQRFPSTYQPTLGTTVAKPPVPGTTELRFPPTVYPAAPTEAAGGNGTDR